MAKAQTKKKNVAKTGYIIGGCILLCGGIGMLLGQTAAGFLIGVGIGLLSAYYVSKS